MLELGNFNFQFFFPGSGRLVFEPFPSAVLKTGITFLLELLYPLVDLLVTDIELESGFTVVLAIGNTVFGNLNPFLYRVGRASFMRLPPVIFRWNPLSLLYTLIQFLN